MSFAQLEEAARHAIEEVPEEEGDAPSKRGKSPSVSAIATKSKKTVPQRDDEMQIYLSEIRYKQEELIQRLREDQGNVVVNDDQISNIPEESKMVGEADSISTAGLRGKRKLVNPSAQVDEVSNSQSAASEQQSEVAALRAELEREKAEKAQLAAQIRATGAAEQTE